jgi:tetratricopeptide (TPR) repeat protein
VPAFRGALRRGARGVRARRGVAGGGRSGALAEQGRGAEAEAAYREAIARKIETLGQTSHEVAASLNNLAVLLADLGRVSEARETIARAVAIAESVLAPAHPIAVACSATAASFE